MYLNCFEEKRWNERQIKIFFNMQIKIFFNIYWTPQPKALENIYDGSASCVLLRNLAKKP